MSEIDQQIRTKFGADVVSPNRAAEYLKIRNDKTADEEILVVRPSGGAFWSEPCPKKKSWRYAIITMVTKVEYYNL